MHVMDAAALCALCLLFAFASSANAKPKISYSQPGQVGVRLITPDSPEFLLALRGRIDPPALAILEPLLPFSVIVKNDGQRAVAALAVIWSLKNSSGKPITNTLVHHSLAKAPDRVLRAGDFLVITPVLALNQAIQSKLFDRFKAAEPNRQQDVLKLYAAQAEIGISLDSVVFDDGELIGPDTAMLAARINGQVRAHKAMDSALQSLSAEDFQAFVTTNASLRIGGLKPPPASSIPYAAYEEHVYRKLLNGICSMLMSNLATRDAASIQREARSMPGVTYISEVRRKQ